MYWIFMYALLIEIPTLKQRHPRHPVLVPQVSELARTLVKPTISLWKFAQSKLLPTPSKLHYLFNMRELSRTFQGVLAASKDRYDKSVSDKEDAGRASGQPPQLLSLSLTMRADEEGDASNQIESSNIDHLQPCANFPPMCFTTFLFVAPYRWVFLVKQYSSDWFIPLSLVIVVDDIQLQAAYLRPMSTSWPCGSTKFSVSSVTSSSRSKKSKWCKSGYWRKSRLHSDRRPLTTWPEWIPSLIISWAFWEIIRKVRQWLKWWVYWASHKN